MSDLLTAKDVELKTFKKASFGGYVVAEVEEFLNQLADDIEAYSLRSNEQQRRILELEEALKKHEGMKDMIKDALILAQKSAKDKDAEACLQAEKTIEEAHLQAASIVSEAKDRIAEIDSEVQRRLNEAEQEIASRMEKASDEALKIAVAARSDARDLLRTADERLANHRNEMESLRLERENFLKGARSLLLHFGQVVGEARQKSETLENEEKHNGSEGDLGTKKFPESPFLDAGLDERTNTRQRPLGALNEEGADSVL